MRVALVHTAFFNAGGGERLLLEMRRALKDLGHEVDLYTAYFDKRAWDVITNGMSDVPEPIILREPMISKIFRKAQLLRALLAAWRLEEPVERLRLRYDLIIETFLGVPLKWADATYVHFPLVDSLKFLMHQYRLRLYERAYNSLAIWMARALADSTKPIMTNSTWTVKYIRGAYGSQRVYVVHPPVNVEELSSIDGGRGRIVLTVSRIDWAKRVAEIPEVARLVPEAEFYLVGSTRPESGPVLEVLKERAEELSNFHLETNVPRKRIIELMSQASIYLHPPFAEHFGIAIAEAAAAGLVPVVYRDGGGWTDIVSRIDKGLGYASVEEAARIIRSLLNDPERLKALSARAREVAKGFSYERFKERLNEVISSLSPDISTKQRNQPVRGYRQS
ncbi:MAG: glycosyltransferase family 4 protein [Acidianus sp.]|nr:glycosyltransferase family 4 protein [Acidianus sp.]